MPAYFQMRKYFEQRLFINEISWREFQVKGGDWTDGTLTNVLCADRYLHSLCPFFYKIPVRVYNITNWNRWKRWFESGDCKNSPWNSLGSVRVWDKECKELYKDACAVYKIFVRRSRRCEHNFAKILLWLKIYHLILSATLLALVVCIS